MEVSSNGSAGRQSSSNPMALSHANPNSRRLVSTDQRQREGGGSLEDSPDGSKQPQNRKRSIFARILKSILN